MQVAADALVPWLKGDEDAAGVARVGDGAGPGTDPDAAVRRGMPEQDDVDLGVADGEGVAVAVLVDVEGQQAADFVAGRI